MATEESPIRENCQPAFTVEGGDPAAREFVHHFVDTNSHGIMHVTMNAMREGFIDDRVLPAPTPQAPQRPIARNFRGYGEAMSITARIQEVSAEAPVRCERCTYWSFTDHARHVCPDGNRHAPPAPLRGPHPSTYIHDEMAVGPRVLLIGVEDGHEVTHNCLGEISADGWITVRIPIQELTVHAIEVEGWRWPDSGQLPASFGFGATIAMHPPIEIVANLRRRQREQDQFSQQVIGFDPGNPRALVLRNPDGSVSYARDQSRARPWKGIPRDELEDGMVVMVTLPMRVMTAEAANARRVAAMPLDMVRNLVACPYGGIIEIREYIE